MSVGWYNGFHPEVRRASLPLLRAAIRNGLIAKPSQCSICGFRNGDDPSGRTWLQHHDENYLVVAPYEIDRNCHRILHMRWERPRPWLRLVAAYADGRKWFELLTMDPASLTRPVHETYPEHLPPASSSDKNELYRRTQIRGYEVCMDP